MTVVIGVGNDWRRDDAAGLAVARRLRGRVPARVCVLEREGEPVALLEAWTGADEAVVIDAISSGAPPGTVHRLDAGRSPLPAQLFRGSTHALGLAEAVELARVLGRLPDRMLVYGIEGETFAAGSGLSPAVARAVERVADELGERLRGPPVSSPAPPGPPPRARSGPGRASS
jgi:hydrogenase maturation protease